MKMQVTAIAHKSLTQFALAITPDQRFIYMYRLNKWVMVFGPPVLESYKHGWFVTIAASQKVTRGKLFIEVVL